MSSERTFLALCIPGKATPDSIDDFVDQWHVAPRGTRLHEYLGMTTEEYSLWIRVPDALSYIVRARREEKTLNEVVIQGCRELQRTGPRGDASRITRLEEWLKTKGELI